MRKQELVNWRRLLWPLLLLAIFLSGCGQNQLAKEDVMTRVERTKTITWGVKNDTRLFGLTNIKTRQIDGFDADMARLLSKTIFGKRIKVDLVPVTSNTRLPLLKNGNVDALAATMTITAARRKEIDFTRPYFNAGQALLVKQGSAIKSVQDLTAGTQVIGIQGSNSVENIKKYAPQAQVNQLADAAQAFSALKAGQGDALTSDNGILYGLSSDDPNYVVVGGTFTSEPYGIGINKGQHRFKKALNQALKKIQANGDYQSLIDKWFSLVDGFDGSVVK